MADGSERTTEEREAGRRERERRRAGVFNDPEEHLPPIVRRTPAESPPTVEHDVLADHGEDEPPDEGFDDAEPPEVERPSGTRRVSRLAGEGLNGRPRAARHQRSPRPPRRPPARGRSAARATGEGRHSWLGRFVALVMVVFAAVVIWFAIEVFQPFGTSPHGQVTVSIPAHSGAHQIGNLLAREGVIPSGFFFEVRAALSGDRSRLRSGTYHLQQGMSYSAVLTKLTTPPPVAKTSQLTIGEGHTRQYVSRLLRQQRIGGSYLAATRSSPSLNPRAYGAPGHLPSLEGFLFPDTFQLVDPVKVSALVAAQLRDFKQRFATVDLAYARSKHLTDYDVLKIASLIEGEAATAHDLPLVASVIYNRLARRDAARP